MTFDAATFAAYANPVPAPAALAEPDIRAYIRELEAAAERFGPRRDRFAEGKEQVCMDIAASLRHYGSFVSEKQQAYAWKLIGWSLPLGARHPLDTAPAAAPAPAPVAPLPEPNKVPQLFALMQRLAKLTIGKLTLARKNQDSLVWVKVTGADGVVGKIENGVVSIFTARLDVKVHGISAAEILADLLRIEADPEAAAVLHGKASGCCAVCNRDLTNPASIERGVGPICAGRAGW
jgi:hypothetical protein